MFPIRDPLPSRHVPVATSLIIADNAVFLFPDLGDPAHVVPHDTFSTGGFA
ncbi:MAG TPA: hypothetical protein VK392_07230 [Thermoanaerobaculia bacterium]|nr:hypothetical protein [Thermoanaerobaculia bacterium]